MVKQSVSRIVEAVAFLMIQLGLSEVPSYAWGWRYRSSNDVYRSKTNDSRVRLNAWDGTTIRGGGYAGELRCVECRRLKTFAFFREDKTYASGYRHICLDCERSADRKRYLNKIGNEPRRYHRAKQEIYNSPC